MEKLKSLGSNLRSSATSNKLSKAFRFDGNKGVLGGKAESGRSGNPFLDGPNMEELFLSFLAIATIGAVAGFQAKWVRVSGGVAFTLFLLLLAFFLQTALLLIPLIYDRWDRLKRPAQFLAQTRSTFILHAFGSVLLLLAAMIQTISTWTSSGCKDPASDPHASLGDDYKNALGQWCVTRRASAIFDWLTFGCWLVLFTLTAIAFRRERKREPGFTAPGNDQGISYATYTHPEDGEVTYRDKMAQPEESIPIHAHEAPSYSVKTPYSAPVYNAPVYEDHAGYSAVRNHHSGRASADLYGDGNRMSRTMQMAQAPTPAPVLPPPRAPQQPTHFDPYAQIRDSLMQPRDGGYGYGQNALYQTGGQPHPPAYGYRQ